MDLNMHRGLGFIQAGSVKDTSSLAIKLLPSASSATWGLGKWISWTYMGCRAKISSSGTRVSPDAALNAKNLE